MTDDARHVDGSGFDAWLAVVVRTPTILTLRTELDRVIAERDALLELLDLFDLPSAETDPADDATGGS